MQPLKPCPFCGDPDPTIDEIDDDLWAVVCNACGCHGPTSEDTFGAAQVGEINGLHDAVIHEWNLRAADRVPDFLSEALNSGDGVYRP